jgi:Trk K+ transport system NAD-binding subunit
MKPSNRRFSRKIRAAFRDTLLLLREFLVPLAIFLVIVVGGGLLYYLLAEQAGEPLESFAQAVYLLIGLTFFQPTIDFPHDWHLQIFFFLVPVIGLGAIAQGVAEFGVLFFNRKSRSKEWEMAVASTYNNHIILIGLGHLGYQTLKSLINLGQDVVVIEMNPDSESVSEVKALGIPILAVDANKRSSLKDAGIAKAKSIILCTQNDPLNMQIAIKAKSMNPKLQVIARIFDQHFAKAIEEQFDYVALSSSVMSAPAFASAAIGLEMTRPIAIEGSIFSLARFDIGPDSKLIGINVGSFEKKYNASIVLIRKDTQTSLHPNSEHQVEEGDIVAVIAGPNELKALLKANG